MHADVYSKSMGFARLGNVWVEIVIFSISNWVIVMKMEYSLKNHYKYF